jgi:AcrR family transcriptional regulator
MQLAIEVHVARKGLSAESVVLAAAELADDLGWDALGLQPLAERLGVKVPSLYNHTDGLAGLRLGVGRRAMAQLTEALRDALVAQAGGDGRARLGALARAYRDFARKHPGQYASLAGVPAAETLPLLHMCEAMLAPYHLPKARFIHTLRVLRSALHGFVLLELSGGFEYRESVEQSFEHLIAMFDQAMDPAVERPAARR